jgi:hypothetical protein
MAPKALMLIKIVLIFVEEFTHQKGALIRKMPYPPNFNKIPARIMDPATGAST